MQSTFRGAFSDAEPIAWRDATLARHTRDDTVNGRSGS
jgi:hypothetical protein